MKRANLPLAFWLLCAAAISFSEVSYAESPDMPMVPKAPVTWLPGPANVQLGAIADLKVPEGYKFTDGQGAMDELTQLKVVVPKGLLGILEPASRVGWCITVQFSPVGFVGGIDNKASLNEASMLKNATESLKQQAADRASLGMVPLSNIAWETRPLLDPAQHSLEWALKADAGSEHLVLHTVRLFTRYGVLDLAAIRPAKSAQAAQLKEIAQGIVLRTGQAYTEFEGGDKIASINLTDLVLSPASAKTATAVNWLNENQKSLWLAGAGLFVLATGGVLLVRKSRKSRVASDSAPATAEPAAAFQRSAPAIAAKPIVSVQTPVASKPRTMSQLAMNKAAGLAKPLNHSDQNGHHSSRRKKVFDYNRYFTDLMSAVSSQANQADVYQTNGHSLDNGRLMTSAEVSENGTAPANYQNAEMIAHQKLLIEEQKRIIQEQSKLIEEKSRLIAEKNQLLKMQAELMDGKLL